MARPGLTKHRKFRRLARLLGSDVLALGHLEWLWSVAYEDGNDYLGDADDVESAAKWTGDPGVLARALLTCGGHGHAGFIEPDPDHPDGHYRVHELWDHAPRYVKRRAAREQERKDTVRPLDGQRAATGRPLDVTPAPAPSTQHPHPAPRSRQTAARVSSGPHKTHALCGQVCLPAFLFQEFARLRGGDEGEARTYVEEWWLAVDADLARGHPPIGDGLTYLRQRWGADHPTPKPTAKVASFDIAAWAAKGAS